jgi:hypothetical protein
MFFTFFTIVFSLDYEYRSYFYKLGLFFKFTLEGAFYKTLFYNKLFYKDS